LSTLKASFLSTTSSLNLLRHQKNNANELSVIVIVVFLVFIF